MHQTNMSYIIRAQTTQQAAICTLPITNDEQQTALYNHWNENGYIPEVGQYILQNLQSQNIHPIRGDIFWKKPNHYRNDGVLIYDGQKFISLDYKPDDYGTIPQQFKVITEFPPLYWANAIDHNEYIWPGQMVLKNLHQQNIKKTSFMLSNESILHLPYVSVIYKGLEYYFMAGNNNQGCVEDRAELKRQLRGAGPDNTNFMYVDHSYSGMPVNDNIVFFDRWDDKMSATPFAAGLERDMLDIILDR